jgi:hypothetical protein
MPNLWRIYHVDNVRMVGLGRSSCRLAGKASWDAVTFAPVTGTIGVDLDQRPPRITASKYHWQLIQQPLAESLFRRNHVHGKEPENAAYKHFAAFCLAGSGLRCRCHPDHLGDDISCVGGEDVAGVGWLPKLPEGRPKLRELQAVRPTVLLHAR